MDLKNEFLKILSSFEHFKSFVVNFSIFSGEKMEIFVR